MPGQLLIDHHDWRGARAIAIFNSAPGLHRNLRASPKYPGSTIFSRTSRNSFTPGTLHEFAPPHTFQRQSVRDRCLLHSGHGSEPLHDGFIES